MIDFAWGGVREEITKLILEGGKAVGKDRRGRRVFPGDGLAYAKARRGETAWHIGSTSKAHIFRLGKCQAGEWEE